MTSIEPWVTRERGTILARVPPRSLGTWSRQPQGWPGPGPLRFAVTGPGQYNRQHVSIFVLCRLRGSDQDLPLAAGRPPHTTYLLERPVAS